MAKIDWRRAFYHERHEPLPLAHFSLVVDHLLNWDEWDITHLDGFITRIEDADGDGVWDSDWEDPREFSMYFSDRLIRSLNNAFWNKKPIFVGKAAVLPLPVDSPSSKMKGAISSSSF